MEGARIVPGTVPGTAPNTPDKLAYFFLATTRRGGVGIFLLRKLRHRAFQ